MKIQEKLNKNILLYLGKCLAGCAVALSMRQFFQYEQSVWFLLSTLLVLSPAGEEALPFTLDRIKANLIGSLCCLIILTLGIEGDVSIYIAVIMTVLVCASVSLIGVARPALAAVAIILMHPMTELFWETAVSRLLAVVGGCLSALIISYVFHLGRIHKKVDKKSNQYEA